MPSFFLLHVICTCSSLTWNCSFSPLPGEHLPIVLVSVSSEKLSPITVTKSDPILLCSFSTSLGKQWSLLSLDSKLLNHLFNICLCLNGGFVRIGTMSVFISVSVVSFNSTMNIWQAQVLLNKWMKVGFVVKKLCSRPALKFNDWGCKWTLL